MTAQKVPNTSISQKFPTKGLEGKRFLSRRDAVPSIKNVPNKQAPKKFLAKT
jgi:hypothetical protein